MGGRQPAGSAPPPPLHAASPRLPSPAPRPHACTAPAPAMLRRHLPLARDLVRVARQRLVFRLDSYCKRDNRLFQDVIK